MIKFNENAKKHNYMVCYAMLDHFSYIKLKTSVEVF